MSLGRRIRKLYRGMGYAESGFSGVVTYVNNTRVTSGADTRVTSGGDTRVTKDKA